MGILVALPIAAAIAILDRRKIEDFLFLAIGIIISLIFLFGYFGNTLPGVYAGITLAVISLMYCAVMFFKERIRFKESVLTQGLGGISICTLVAAIICFGMKDLGAASDLYRVYAPQIINMYLYNNWGSGELAEFFSLLHNAPVCPVWSYFCNKLWFCYSDSVIMWSRHIYIISAFAPLYSLLGKKEWKKNLLISFIVMNLPYTIQPTFCYLNDVPMGCTAAYGTLMTINLYRNRLKYNDLGCLAACCWGVVGTCLMKRLGPVFIYGIVGTASVYTVNRFVEKKEGYGVVKKIFPLFFMALSISMVFAFNMYRSTYYADDKLYTYFPIILFIGFVMMGIVYYCMFCLIKKGRYITVMGLVLTAVAAVYYLLLIFGAHYSDMDGAREVISGYAVEWFNELAFDNGFNLPDPLFMVIFLLMMLILGRQIEKRRITSLSTSDDMGFTSGILILGAVIAAMAILCTYFQNELLPRVHTYRYLRPAILVMIVVMIYELLCIKSKYSTHIVVLLTAVLVLLLPPNNIVAKLLPGEGEKRWDIYKGIYADAGVELTAGDKILYVGKDYYAIYASFPAYATWYRPEDENINELKSWVLIYGWDYLLLDDYDNDFPDIYQEMFEGGKKEIKEGSLYDVIVDGGSVRFVRIKGD